MIGYDTITPGKRYLLMHQNEHKAAELCIEMASVLVRPACLHQIFVVTVLHTLSWIRVYSVTRLCSRSCILLNF